MQTTRYRRLLFASVVALTVAASALAKQAARPTRQGSVFGINLGWEPGWDTTGTVRLLGIARNMVGEWGYLRHGFDPKGDVENCRRSMAMIRAHHLIPITGGAHPEKQFLEEGKSYPRLDADGSMRTAARHKARIWREMHEAKVPFYVVEVMNEVNIGDSGWPADKYAQWLYDFAVEVKSAYPGLKVCSCGMAGSGAEYYDNMLTFKPELENVVDFWGLHPYGANHPPEYKPQGCSLRCYEETKAVLKKHGVDPIRLMCTETGYELELSDTGKDPNYPPIKEDNRAEYMARAFRDYYVPEPMIEAVCVFQLWDFPWHNWNGWDLMYHDGRPRPIYEAMAAEPKPAGKDWLPTGPGRITGRITWRDTDIGIPRVVVYIKPGLYAAVTDDLGYYGIGDLPKGKYQVTAFRDGYRVISKRTRRNVAVDANKPARLDWRMERVSLVDPGFRGAGGKVPAGWTVIGSQEKRPDFIGLDNRWRDARMLRISVSKGQEGGVLKYGDYSSAYPNEVFVAEVFVRTESGKVEPGRGPYLELALSNGRGELTRVAKVYVSDSKGGRRPQRITAAVYGPARSTRVRLACGVEGAEGTFWFSEPFVGEADFPLPADAKYRTTGYVPPLYKLNKSFFAQAGIDIAKRNPELKTATITGQVLDFRGRPLARATVATDEPLFCTLTDEQGRYELTVLAQQRMRVRAFALGETPAVSEPIRLDRNEAHRLNLQTAPPPAPAKLVNGDFNTYHPTEPGLMTGWTGFGTTDGIYESGHAKIVVYDKAFSYEGKGLYFAQSGSNTKNGGAYQVVQATPGQKYKLTGQVFTYTHGEAKKPMDNNCRLGLDPTGGRDPDRPDVAWTKKTQSEKKWTKVAVEATAQTCRITVFVRHEMRRGNYWNLTMFDDVKLEKVD